MIRLSTHFSLEEFQKGDDAIPTELAPIFSELCETILEAVREVWQKDLVITSGYRSPKENAEAHGQPNSEHMATKTHCAADFYVAETNTRVVFDWMRENPTLPFHQLIYETDARGGAIVHVSINKLLPGTRSVLIGATHNAEPYQKVDYVAYSGPTPGEGVLPSDEG